MSQRQPTSRRRFLKHAGVFLVTGIATSGSDTVISSDPHSVAAELIRLLHMRDQAGHVGHAYLKAGGDPNLPSVADLTRTLLERLGFDVQHLTLVPTGTLRSIVVEKVHQDYEEEHVAVVDDWLLSETEANLCAILFLESREKPGLI